jgi:hypothetical protein
MKLLLGLMLLLAKNLVKYEKTDTGIEQIIPFTDFSNILPSDLILELVADHWFGTLNQTCLNLESSCNRAYCGIFRRE